MFVMGVCFIFSFIPSHLPSSSFLVLVSCLRYLVVVVALLPICLPNRSIVALYYCCFPSGCKRSLLAATVSLLHPRLDFTRAFLDPAFISLHHRVPSIYAPGQTYPASSTINLQQQQAHSLDQQPPPSTAPRYNTPSTISPLNTKPIHSPRQQYSVTTKHTHNHVRRPRSRILETLQRSRAQTRRRRVHRTNT